MTSAVAPPIVGEPTRSGAVHVAMWELYVVEGLSAKVTAARLNVTFRRNRMNETGGSVASYAHRQGWAKAGVNGLPQLPQAHYALAAPTMPAPKLGKGPLKELALLAPPPPPKPAPRPTGNSRGPGRQLETLERPKELKPVNLDLMDPEPEAYGVPTLLGDLHSTQCKFPVPRGIHHPVGEMHLQLFCGARREEDSPYCSRHTDIAYPNGIPKKA